MTTAARTCFDPEDQYVYDHLAEQYRDLERSAEAAQLAANAALNGDSDKPEEFVCLITDELTDDRQSMLRAPTVQLDLCGLVADSLEELADQLELVVKALRAK